MALFALFAPSISGRPRGRKYRLNTEAVDRTLLDTAEKWLEVLSQGFFDRRFYLRLTTV